VEPRDVGGRASPRLHARKQLLELCGQVVAHAESIDFDAPEEEFIAQLKANRAFEDSLEPEIEQARERVRRADVFANRRERVAKTQRSLATFAARPRGATRVRGRRRNVRTLSRRTHGPPSSAEDSEPPSASWTFIALASRRMLQHERRREARWRRRAVAA
jgi:hypothetical protein